MGVAVEQGRVDVAGLVARIRDEFPDIGFEKARLDDLGDDHAVVILDDAWVFRFPRTAGAAALAAGERRLLERLRDVSPLAVPRYDRVSGAGDFAGYPMIPGRELTEAIFASLPREVQVRSLASLGRFLATLHALPASLVTPPDCAIGPVFSGADCARRYVDRSADFAHILGPALRLRVDRFYEALPAVVDAAPLTLIHGDLTADHILLAKDAAGLSGVIDFTDAGPGDPAYDFCWLWAYGAGAPGQAARHYGLPQATAGILARSRWWFIRYSVERLWWRLNGWRACDEAKVVADIRAGLEASGL